MHSREAQMIGVLHHVDQRNDAGPALRGVEHVASPRVSRNIVLSLIPDVDAVETVIKNRNPDEEQLQKKNSGQAIQKLNLLAISQRAFEGFGVRDEMFEKKGSNGHDAAERMQAPEPKRRSLARAQRRNAQFYCWSGCRGTGGRRHDDCSLLVRYES